MKELAYDDEITSPEVRDLPTGPPGEGVGVCEAPRGTLFHHYRSNEQGILEELNLVVATQNSAAAISMSVEKAARAFVTDGRMTDETQNMIEMAFRAFDPCLACATH